MNDTSTAETITLPVRPCSRVEADDWHDAHVWWPQVFGVYPNREHYCPGCGPKVGRA